MKRIAEQFDHYFRVISEEAFLRMESLNGEIPFYIATYEPMQQLEVEAAVRGLKNKLEMAGVRVSEINLYDVALGIIEQELGLREAFSIEMEMDKDEFKEALQSVLDIQTVLVPRLRHAIQGASADVYFLTGVGLVFPYLRTHNVLNNLQNIAKDAPTVIFFPGNYNGQSLDLFGRLRDDNYYRAFNINS